MDVFGAVVAGLSATLIFELCTQVRKLLDVAYVPIYFQFLPLNVLNKDLSVYLGDDYWLGPTEGQRLTRAQALEVKGRIQRRGILAVAVSALAIPAVAGFGVAQYMAQDGLWPAIVGILLLQGYRMRLSVRDFKYHASLADSRTVRSLVALYIGYAAVIAWVFHSVYFWTRRYVEAENYAGLVGDLADLLIGKVIVSGILIAALAAVFLSVLTNRHIPLRDEGYDTDD